MTTNAVATAVQHSEINRSPAALTATLLGLVAGGILILRWPWKPLYGFNFLANCAIVVAGAGTMLMLGQNEVHLMFLPIASLMLHLSTAIA